MTAVTADASAELPLPSSSRALTWRRLTADRVALASALFILFVLVACFLIEPIAEQLLGHGPNALFPHAVDINLKPVGPWSHVQDIQSTGTTKDKTLLILGADGPLGRDEFLRLLAGGRTSLEIALGATAIALVIGTFLGAIAGFYGGWIDIGLSRLTEFVMGFPIFFLVIALGFTLSYRLSQITLGGIFVPGALSLIVVIGLFNWF